MDEKFHPGRVIILVYLGTLTHRIINQKGGLNTAQMLNGKSWSVTAILLTFNLWAAANVRGLFNNHVSLVSLDWGKHCKKTRLFTRNPWRDVTREWFRQLINQPWGSLPRTSEGWPGWIYVRVWCLVADLTGNWKMRAHTLAHVPTRKGQSINNSG